MSNKGFLESVSVTAPCQALWTDMVGGEKVRYCGSCQKMVYNLGAMRRSEARKLVVGNIGKICVRYAGREKELPSQSKLHQISRSGSSIAAGVLAATLVITGMADGQISSTRTTGRTQGSTKNLRRCQISFTVLDPRGEPIEAALVELFSETSYRKYSASAGEDGVATLRGVPAGRYRVRASSKYFHTNQSYILLQEAIEPNVSVMLEVGAAIGTINVRPLEIPIFIAVAQEDNTVVKKMIRSGFDIHKKDCRGVTLLHVAVEYANFEMVKYLISKGAKVNSKDKVGRTPLLMLDDDEIGLEIFRILVKNGANLNLRDEDGQTPLMIACDDENIDLVKLLLDAGANPNIKDDEGETALKKTNSEAIKKMLIDRMSPKK